MTEIEATRGAGCDVVPGVPDTPETAGVPGDDVAALRAENGRLRAANERLRMLLDDKDAQIAELKAGNGELEERVARLERLISRNSGNSSMPPSTDDLPGKKPPGGCVPGLSIPAAQ